MNTAEIRNIIDKKMIAAMVAHFEKGEVFDALKFAYNGFYTVSEDFDYNMIENEEYFQFDFPTYYEEIDDWCTNTIRISNDFHDVHIKLGYGNFNFYETYHSNGKVMEKTNKILPEFITSKKEKNYCISISR